MKRVYEDHQITAKAPSRRREHRFNLATQVAAELLASPRQDDDHLIPLLHRQALLTAQASSQHPGGGAHLDQVDHPHRRPPTASH